MVETGIGVAVTFTQWQVESAQAAFGADGLVNVDEHFVFSGPALSANYQSAGYGMPNSHAYQYADWSQDVSSSVFLPLNFSGSASIDGDAVSLSGGWDWADECTSRPATGALVAAGDNTTTFDFGGGCSQCVPWATTDGLSGEWCPPA